MKRGLKSLGIDWSCKAHNWVFDRIIVRSVEGSARERFGFWLERLLSRAFSWCYEGSAEEAADDVDWALDEEISSEWLTSRGREIRARRSEWI